MASICARIPINFFFGGAGAGAAATADDGEAAAAAAAASICCLIDITFFGGLVLATGCGGTAAGDRERDRSALAAICSRIDMLNL